MWQKFVVTFLTVCILCILPCYSDFLFAISHPDKEGYPQHDLSEDPDVILDTNIIQSFTPRQLALERVIAKTFAEYHINGIITNRIRTLFSSKLWRMGNKIVGSGGTSRENLLTKWKSVRWKIEFREDEMADKHIVSAVTSKRCTALQEKLDHCGKKLKETTNQLKTLEQSVVRLSNKLRSSETPSRRPKRKAWGNCTSQYQNQQRKKIKVDVQAALSFTETENFQPVGVEMINKDTKEIIRIDCRKTDSSLGRADESVVEKTLYVKERFNISNVAYHELAQINPQLPRQSSLAKASKEMNSEFKIQPTPGNTTGVQQSISDRLRVRLCHVLKSNPSFASKESIRIKITGDGTVVSRSLRLVVIAFSLLVDEENSSSPHGNHTIALIKTTEDYGNMAEALKTVTEDVKTMSTISVNGVTFSVEFFLGADWKFLALAIGIKSASAKHFCIWCKCSDEE